MFFDLGFNVSMDQKNYWEDSTHIRSIKRGCLTSFSIKHLYTQLDVSDIMIYHKCHNPSLGLATKARGCKVVDQEGSPGVQKSVRE
jgi:hypothetical protein